MLGFSKFGMSIGHCSIGCETNVDACIGRYLYHALVDICICSVSWDKRIHLCVSPDVQLTQIWFGVNSGAARSSAWWFACWLTTKLSKHQLSQRIGSRVFIFVEFVFALFAWSKYQLKWRFELGVSIVVLLYLILYFCLYVFFVFLSEACTRSSQHCIRWAVGAFSYLNDSQTFLKFIVDASI